MSDDADSGDANGATDDAASDPLADVPEGLTHEATWQVGEIEPQEVADGVAVAATPEIIGYMEQTVYDGVDPHLPDGYRVVGVRIECDHRAPTPVEESVAVAIEVEAVDAEREQVVSTATVEDEGGVAATGRMRHAVVERAAFAERVRERAGGE